MATNSSSLSANILAGCLARTFGKPPEDSAPEVATEQERIPSIVDEMCPPSPEIIPFGMIQQNPAGDDGVHSLDMPVEERKFNQVCPANEKPAFERLEPGLEPEFRVTEFMPAAQVVTQKPLSNKSVAPYAVLQGMGDSAFTLTFSGGGSGATASLVLAQDGLLPEARFESGLCHISPQHHGDMAEESRNGVSPTAEIRNRDHKGKRIDAIGAGIFTGILLLILAAFLGAYFKSAPLSKSAAPVAAMASVPDPAMPKAAMEDATAPPQAPVAQQDANDPPTKPEKKSKKRKAEALATAPKDISPPPSPMGLGAFAGAAPAPAPAPTPALAAMRPEEYKPAAPSARIHEQTSMMLTEIVPSGTGKTVAWFYDRGAQVPLKEGDRLPGSGGVIRKINVAKGSVTVSDNGVETMFFVGKL